MAEIVMKHLHDTLQPHRGTRVAAEKALEAMEGHDGFAPTLLGLVHNQAGTVPMGLQQAAAVYFKRLVMSGWERGEASKFSEDERTKVKATLVDLMCVCPEGTRRLISDALTVISSHDFPENWGSLLDNIIARMATQDFRVINGLLETANSVLRRFRTDRDNTPVRLALKYCLDKFQAPLLSFFTSLMALLPKTTGKEALTGLLTALRSISRIFLSLNSITIPEYFETHKKEWFSNYLLLLKYSNPLLVDPEEEDESGPIERLQEAVVENVNLYASHYESEFMEFFDGFVGEIWGMLTRTPGQQKYDSLVATSMKFLISVCSKSMYAHLFKGKDALNSIITSVVIPNMTMRESDAELFEDNPTEYIQRDAEGSDKDTRRRVAATLVRELARTSPEDVTAACMAQIATHVAAYKANPTAKWTSKELAISLFIAITVRGQTRARGVSEVNPLTNIGTFFVSEIQAELAGDINTLPIVKAAAIKFLTTFRNQLPAAGLQSLLPVVGKFLGADEVVVHSYAASAIERMLTVKTDMSGNKDVPYALQPAALKPVLKPLLDAIFAVLARTDLNPNGYVVKCLCRVVFSAKSEIIPHTVDVLDKVSGIVALVAKDPVNPTYNHALFECIAALVRNVCSVNPAAVGDFESRLFPPFNGILAEDVLEFLPYVFQVLALLLELRPPAGRENISAGYQSLLAPILHPSLWKRGGSVPALCQLVEAYCHQGPDYIVKQERLVAILGLAQKLLNKRATEVSGFRLLSCVVVNFTAAQLQPFLAMIFKVLILRQQSRPKVNPMAYVRLFVEFSGLVAALHGPPVLKAALEANQAGLFVNMLKMVFNPNMQHIIGLKPRRAVSAGVTRILCETPELVKDPVWVETLTQLVVMMELKTGLAESKRDEMDMEIGSEYTGTFSQLSFALSKPKDPLKAKVPNPAAFLGTSLQNLSKLVPGVLPGIVKALPTPTALPLSRYLNGATLA